MRQHRLAPQIQLRSVCCRYRAPWCDHAGVERRLRRPFLLGGSSASDGEIAEDGARDVRLNRLEAVLFLAREPLNTRRIAQFADLADGTEARTLMHFLNELYDAAGRAFRVEEVAGGFQLLSRPQFAPWLRRLGQVPPELRLSTPALETLAVVAYRQPVLRADIEAIRGVGCGEILRQLMERDLVRISGRSDELGRPYLYGTTKRFLQAFGLRNLDALPRAAHFQAVDDEEFDEMEAEELDDESLFDEEEGQRDIADEEVVDQNTRGDLEPHSIDNETIGSQLDEDSA